MHQIWRLFTKLYSAVYFTITRWLVRVRARKGDFIRNVMNVCVETDKKSN